MPLFKEKTTPSHYLNQQINKKMFFLINRGAKVRKMSDNHIILEDIDDWNWKDAKKMNEISKYQLVYDVHSSFTSNTDDIQGLVVSISILENSFVWTIVQYFLSICTCIVFMLWGQCIYVQISPPSDIKM